jgi:hypothetical protein
MVCDGIKLTTHDPNRREPLQYFIRETDRTDEGIGSRIAVVIISVRFDAYVHYGVRKDGILQAHDVTGRVPEFKIENRVG